MSKNSPVHLIVYKQVQGAQVQVAPRVTAPGQGILLRLLTVVFPDGGRIRDFFVYHA